MITTAEQTAPNNWIDYWNNDDFWSSSLLWQKNAEIFFKRSSRFISYRASDRVLNVGCGPGHLEALLAPRVQEITAIDTAPNFVALCKKRCEGFPSVRAEQLDADYTDLGAFGKYSLILCVSVVQYYRDLYEIEALIISAKKAALPGAKMLIADLPLKRNFAGWVWDALCSVWTSLREGYFSILFVTAARLLFKGKQYHKCSSEVKTLSFSRSPMQELIDRLDLDAQWIETSLSVYANRPSLLIQF